MIVKIDAFDPTVFRRGIPVKVTHNGNFRYGLINDCDPHKLWIITMTSREDAVEIQGGNTCYNIIDICDFIAGNVGIEILG